jgi:hypothetical protein
VIVIREGRVGPDLFPIFNGEMCMGLKILWDTHKSPKTGSKWGQCSAAERQIFPSAGSTCSHGKCHEAPDYRIHELCKWFDRVTKAAQLYVEPVKICPMLKKMYSYLTQLDFGCRRLSAI